MVPFQAIADPFGLKPCVARDAPDTHAVKPQLHLLASWLSGALIGVFVGALLLSWLPFLLKPVAIVVIALALNARRTSSSRSLQAGFLSSIAVFAFIVLMLTNTLPDPLLVLLLVVLAFGFGRTVQIARWARSG